ncbi:MAG: glycosyltransferase family 2 protein, partial [Solirubrobacteraceae bacterium]
MPPESVDVIVPFRGGRGALVTLLERLSALELGPECSATVVDNTAGGATMAVAGTAVVRILAATERRSSYHARNIGAGRSSAAWLLFLDADVSSPPDLVRRYRMGEAAPDTAVLAGGIRDVSSGGRRREPLASRYSRARRLIDQSNTLALRAPYAKTANCAVRRSAFEQVGGFVDGIRSGGDADLCFRLAQAGWGLEPRADAVVEHRSRTRLGELLAQRARHGSGAQWLEQRYPGFADAPVSGPVLARRICTGAARAVSELGRGDREGALVAAIDPL